MKMHYLNTQYGVQLDMPEDRNQDDALDDLTMEELERDSQYFRDVNTKYYVHAK